MPLSQDERSLVSTSARGVEVDLTGEMLERLGLLLDLVYGGGSRRRLTAVPRVEAASRHLVDSLFLCPHLPVTGRRILDLGSGAGFPGLVVATLCPEQELVLAERSASKADFLLRAREQLGLDNVTVLAADMRAGTVEEGGFDGLISRATLGPGELLRLGRRALRRGGRLLLQLGPRTLEEYHAARRDGFAELEQRPYALPDLESQLFLVVLGRI